MKKWMLVLVVVTMLALPVVTLAAGGPPPNRGNNNATTRGIRQPVTGETLNTEQKAVLVDFWMDEHKALATYQAVIAQFGNILPFSSISNAEQKHIVALEQVFARYGIAVPATPVFEMATFATIAEACTIAAQAELDNVSLYDALQSQFTQPDILRVIENLRNASQNKHLPAFESCTDGTYTGPINEAGMSGYIDGTQNYGQSTSAPQRGKR